MASRSLNSVQLIGNLTRDPELKYTPSGTAVCTFGLATNRQWVTGEGERKEDVEFHRIVSWQKLAEICGKYLAKGRQVYVQGRLQTRTWKGNDGNERQTTEIVIDEMIMLGSRGDYETSDTVQSEPEEVSVDEDAKKSKEKTENEKDAKKDSKKEKEPSVDKKKDEPKEDIPPDDIPF